MTRYKAGLHKEISSIFDGVPLQNHSLNDNEGGSQTPPYLQNQNPRHIQQETTSGSHEPGSKEPFQKLYKDTAEKKSKIVAEIENGLKGRWLQFYHYLKKKLLPSGLAVNARRQIASLLLIPILSIILIFALVGLFGTKSGVKRPVPKGAEATDAGTNSQKIDWQLPGPYTAQLRDPMKIGPSASRRASGSYVPGSDEWLDNQGQIMLRGIVYNEESAAAVIGMQVVKKGDRIGDITVVKINKNSVDLEKNGQRKTLKVGQSWLISE